MMRSAAKDIHGAFQEVNQDSESFVNTAKFCVACDGRDSEKSSRSIKLYCMTMNPSTNSPSRSY